MKFVDIKTMHLQDIIINCNEGHRTLRKAIEMIYAFVYYLYITAKKSYILIEFIPK